jgi:thioredoxin-like negative regulator of GroEL
MTLSLSPFGARSTYNWGQTAETIDVTFPVSHGVSAKDISITITSNSIQAGLKGSESFVVQVRFDFWAPTCIHCRKFPSKYFLFHSLIS